MLLRLFKAEATDASYIFIDRLDCFTAIGFYNLGTAVFFKLFSLVSKPDF